MAKVIKRTSKKATKSVPARFARDWWEKEPKKKKGMRLCDHCGAVYYDGHWHTAPALSSLLKKSAKPTGKEKTLCLQCQWTAHGRGTAKAGFEGELTLDGLDHLEEKAEILSTVRNFAKKAMMRDPEDRIIAIDDRGPRVVVTTTENQLAVGLGKAVDSSHKGGKLTITWSSDDLPARIYWKRKA